MSTDESTTEPTSPSSGDSPTKTETTDRQTTGERTGTTDERTTDAPSYDTDLVEVGASVLEAATAERPAIIELTVTNHHDIEVPIVPGERSGGPLENLPRFEGSAGEIQPFPREPKHVEFHQGALPEEPTQGCWRWPTDVTVAVEDRPFEVWIEPDGTYRIQHQLYHASDSDCFPNGTYTVDASLKLAEWMESLELDSKLSLEYLLTAKKERLNISVKRTNS
ncbi:hypothetical protein [Halobacterium salinarum]|uniref:hypothetical protein n=1 Tax=Halobacterium salinarum TaxID=2242 RepID=UPI002556F4C6|nr:hypothetical protein [Halobacterium salinarum]MDL0127993.1 hypothetical protein [Halobacterium salinarum]